MESLIGSVLNFGKDHLDTVLGAIFGGGGVLAWGSRRLGLPFFKANKWSKVLREFIDFAKATGKATDEKGDGGKDVTPDEWKNMYKEGREFIKALFS